ncbi:MAG: chorismate synthase [Candidatus Omnitrophica bacterium]|nr:chorismate synthase [Candidatus Omnitrophota bacterium]MBD3268795.1 chorismate synthase [Candidatus Omnitrophota bacterium]
MRILTAGESHGEYNLAIIEGFPKGVKIEESFINSELRRRMSGYGRGARMSIEDDKVCIVSGLRNKITLGSPIAVLVKNRDSKISSRKKDNLPALNVPRPSHADLAGAFKYNDKDVRNILERASARETVSRVCTGAICKQFLSQFEIKIAGFTLSVGGVRCTKLPKNISEIRRSTKNSLLNCPDSSAEKKMIKAIDNCRKNKDTLGGVIQIRIEGVSAGIGDFTHFDRRLDARLAYYLMSIPAVKGFEIGLGFEYSRRKGSLSHDSIYYSPRKGFFRKSNNSGGIEGGVSTGEPIVCRIAMKPIATLQKPLDSVNLCSLKQTKAVVERSDTCAIEACGVIAESMSAFVLTELFLDKFGRDSLSDIKSNYRNFLKSRKKRFS